MAEAVIAKVTEEAVGGCINQIKHHFNYLSHYHENMVNLNTKLQILENKSEEVKVKVFVATDKGETVMASVQKWLGEVNGKKEEAEEILNGKERVGNGCWKGWFLNVNLRYSLSKKAMKKSVDLDTFLAGGVFEIVAHPIRSLAYVFDPAGPSSSKKMKNDIDDYVLEVEENEEYSKEGTKSKMPVAEAVGGLKSRLELLEKVMVAIRDPNIRIIRICGMGGSGKTTVAQHVEQQARAEHLFHEIAMTEVKQNPDPKLLQLHIAELFGLELKEDDVPARAKRLCKRLNGKDQYGKNKRILLILDNVWENKDLEKVGIPLTEKESLCKILLTSRSDIGFKDIAIQPIFNIGILPHPENLILFRQCIPSNSFYDQKIAEELVKKCGGLPISITAIAGAVACKTKGYWTHALTKLRKSEFEGEYAEVFNSLKVSYDFMKNEEIKRFFRLFCFFEKGFDVPIEDLARYGMALGCFTDSEKLYEARNEAHIYADMLLHSNLLLRGGHEGCFKVHDIVWDFVVAAPSNDLFIINNGDALIKSKRMESFQKYTSISLQCKEMVEVPKGVEFQSLKFLQLIGTSGAFEFPNNFCEEMHELNVLAFRSVNLTSLPKSLEVLTKLVSLSFHSCFISSDISFIGNLVKLEILSFAHSNIRELPVQITNLKELRLLDITGCHELIVIAPQVLSKLSSLEELYMRGTPLMLCNGSPVIYSEIAAMSKLVVMHIVMPVHEVLPMDSLFANLKHFKISITSRRRCEMYDHLFENYLDLECDSTVLQQEGVKLLLQETVRMDLQVTNLENLFSLNDSEAVTSNLKKLDIRCCNEMVYLVNTIGHLDQINVFQDLVSLGLYNLPCLVDIFHVRSSNESFVAPFCNLKDLHVENCNELKHLFSSSDATSLNKLEDIKVISCNKVKVVFGKGRRGGDKVGVPNLKYITLKRLPNLIGWCSDVNAPEFLQLETLNIEELPLITSIIHWEIGSSNSSIHPLFNHKGLDAACKFQNLISLIVIECESLKHLSTTSTAISFCELQELSVWDCESLTTLVAEEGRKEEKEKKSATELVILFPKLNNLSLSSLRSLSTYLPKGYTLTWSSLKELELDECGGVWKTLFPNNDNIQGSTSVTIDAHKSIMFSPRIIRELGHVTYIHVSDLERTLEVVFDLEEEFESATLNVLDRLYIKRLRNMVNVWKKVPQSFQGFHNLTALNVSECDSLKYLMVPSIAKCLVKLKRMSIHDCYEMEEIVSLRDEECELDDNIILFPHLEELELKSLLNLKYLEAPNDNVESSRSDADINDTSTSTSNIVTTQQSIDEPALVTFQGIIVCPWPAWSFHKLKTIELDHCNSLVSIFPTNRVVRLPALETLKVEYCKSLQYIFSSSTATSLGQLISLSIDGCLNLIEVILMDCDEQEEVDTKIKVVFPKLTTLQFKHLPKLEGICCRKLSFDCPLLTSLKIKNCLKLRTSTFGYFTTPILKQLTINEDLYALNEEDEDLNTILGNAQIKAEKYLALEKEGTLTIDGFHLAGEHLVAHYSTWFWESSYVDDDIVEQYLIARNVPCLIKPRNNTSSDDDDDDDDDDGDDADDDEDEDEDDDEDEDEDDMKIYKPRTYDVSITYDQNNKSTRFWLKGYDESKLDLPMDLVIEDIMMENPQEYVTIEDHPHAFGPHVCLFPREESNSIAKVLFTNCLRRGFDPNVENHLQLFVDLLFPTIEFDSTMS